MSKLSIIYIASLIILGVLLAFTVFRPMTLTEEFTEAQREHLLETEDGWIVEFLIINGEGRDTDFIINGDVDGKLYMDKVLIQDGGAFNYICEVQRHKLTEGEATFCVYKEGQPDPIEQITYHLR